MILLFLRWLVRLPILLLIGTILGGMVIGIYKLAVYFWGSDIFLEVLKRREKEQQLEKSWQANKDWERRLKYEESDIERREEEVHIQKEKLAHKLRKIDKDIDERNILVGAWQQMNEENTLAINIQVGAIKIVRERILSRASKDSFARALKSVSKEFSLVTPDDIEVVRYYLLEQFIDDADCEAFVMSVFDILVGRHANCYVVAWMLYTMFHRDLPE